jgi:hypothetical protein
MDVALNTIYELCKSHATLMRPFVVFIKSILDSVDRLTVVQIKQVYKALCKLSRKVSPRYE